MEAVLLRVEALKRSQGGPPRIGRPRIPWQKAGGKKRDNQKPGGKKRDDDTGLYDDDVVAANKATTNLIDAIIEVNPKVTKEDLTGPIYEFEEAEKRLQLNSDGSIKNWDLSDCGLKKFPELNEDINITGDLILSGNELTSLPESFCRFTVGGSLLLDDNKLESLPKTLNKIKVGINFNLQGNDALPILVTCVEHDYRTTVTNKPIKF